jgi:hypothetical protein
MCAEIPNEQGKCDYPLLVLSNNSPIILALEKSILSLLEDYDGLCMDDEKDRSALANALAPMILVELFGFTEWGSVSTP